MKKILLILAVLVAAFSGCTEKAPEQEQVKAPMADMANSGNSLESYRFVTETIQKIETFSNSTEASALVITSLEDGAVNLTALNMSISTMQKVSSGQDSLQSMQRELYVIRDMAKVKLDGNWSQAALQDPKYFWVLQNVAEKQAMLLNRSQLAPSGSEMVEGQDCTRIDVSPDMQAYESVLFEQFGSVLPLAYMNLSKLYKNCAVNWTLWVSKDDGLPRMENVKMAFSVNPDILELPSDQIQDFLIKIDLNTTTRYRDYNEPVMITLPEGQRIVPIIGCVCNS